MKQTAMKLIGSPHREAPFLPTAALLAVALAAGPAIGRAQTVGSPVPEATKTTEATEDACCRDGATVVSPWADAAAPQVTSPSAGLEPRLVKSLSDERRAGLLRGEGLGYAMAAELNGIPGPRHVLDMGDRLALSPVQRAEMQTAFDRMRTEAAGLGERIVAAEEELDRRFVDRQIDDTTLAALTGRIAELEGKLRYVHLRAHLEADAVLTDEQRKAYSESRGYGVATAAEHSGHSHHD